MIGRWFIFGLIYIAGGLPIAYFLIMADNQKPWLIALIVYFIAASVIGNWFVFFSERKTKK